MKGFETFKIYQSLKLHFTNYEYNSFNYNFKTNVNLSTFEKRKDKYYFQKWENEIKNREVIISFLVSNFLEGKMYIIDFSREVHKGRVARLESLTYNFEKELKLVAESGISFDNACITFSENSFLNRLMRNEISFETFALLNIMLGFTNTLKSLSDPLEVYGDWILRIEKYQMFLRIPKEKKKKLKKIILNAWKK